MRPLDRADRRRRRARRGARMNYASTRDAGARRRRCPWHSGTGSRPTAGCTSHARCRGSRRRALVARASLPALARGLLAPFFDGDALAPALAAISVEAFDVPRRSCPSRTARNACPCSSCSTVRRRPSRISAHVSSPPAWRACASRNGRLSPSSWRPPATRAPRWRRPSTGDPACASWSCIPKGRVSPIQEQQLTRLGRQRAKPRRPGQLRRLPAAREAGVRATRTCASGFALTSANSINIGRLLPQLVLFASAALAVPGEATASPRKLRDPIRQPRARDRLRVGARDGAAGRRDRARAQCQPDRARLPGRRQLAAPRERRDAGLGDGCRRSEQHGATDGAVSRMPRRSRAALRAVSIDDAAIRDSIRAEFAAWRDRALPAHARRASRPTAACPESRAPRVALGRGGDRPSGEVPGDRRAARRPARRAAAALAACSVVRSAGAADRRRARRARRSTRGGGMHALTRAERRRGPTAADVAAAAVRIRGQVIATPCLHSPGLSSATGAEIHVKFENRQVTASFKERGALNSLLQLGEPRARPRRHDGVRRQSWPGGRLSRAAARDSGDRRDAPPHAVRQGRADAGARRRGRAARERRWRSPASTRARLPPRAA